MTKREQSAQDVPLSVSMVSGDAIVDKSIHSMRDLAASVGNLWVGQGVAADVITMRGLGTGQDRSFEQSVGMFIDGQYMPRSRQYQAPFFDVERVEVVRGPQAVLFGLNSSAGAISITTRRSRPGDEFDARILAAYETEYQGTTLEGALGGSVGETLGLRIAARYRDSDGYYRNLATGEEEGDAEESLVRLLAVWEPSESVSVIAKYEFSDYETLGNIGESYGEVAEGLEPTDGRLNWVRTADAAAINPFGVFSGDSPRQSGELTNIQLDLDWALGPGTLSFLYGNSEFEYTILTDLDGTGVPFIDSGIDPELYDQDSFEVRFTSTGETALQFLGGLYWHDTALSNYQNNAITNSALEPVIGTPTWEATSIFEQDSELFSAYASVDWIFAERASLNLGARYTNEDKSTFRDSRCGGLYQTDPMFVPIPGLPACPTTPDGFTASRNSTNLMPEISLQYDVSDDLMLYGKYSESAKSGGFNANTASAIDNIEYDDEKSSGFEFGIKSMLADGRMRLNVTVFHNEFEDLQVSTADVTIDGTGTVIVTPVIANVADSTSQGLEVEFQWSAAEWLQIGLSGALLDTEYDSFPNATCNPSNAGSADPVTGLCDLSGSPLTLAAEYSGNLFADVSVPFSNRLKFIGGVDVNFSDAYFSDPLLDPAARQEAWTMINARAGIAAEDDRWSVSMIGRNLTDETVLDYTEPFVTTIGYIRAPMTLSVQGTMRFGI